MPRGAPRLTLRIAVYTAAALLFAAGAILWFVEQRATSQAEGHAAGRAHFIAEVLLRDRLTESDFAKPSVGKRRRELDSLFYRAVQAEGIKRVNLIAPSGLVTYSTEPSLIGRTAHDESSNVAGALSGREIRVVEHEDIDGKRVKVLETYLPVRSQGTGGVALGVFELYQDYETRVAAQAQHTVLPVAGFLILALLVL